MTRCSNCGQEVHEGCTYNQGRCPHAKPMIDEILLDKYKTRFYNLINFFRKK